MAPASLTRRQHVHSDDAGGLGNDAMSTVLRLVAAAVSSDEQSTFPILLIFALLGLVASLWAVSNGIEIVNF